MSAFWESKFEELAKFNADNDKTKYSQIYINKMEKLQTEYDEKRIAWARASGYIVI